MICHDVRKTLRLRGPGGLSETERRHLGSCAGCSAAARAAALLRLGSDLPPVAGPRPGFAERLRTRLATEDAGRAAMDPRTRPFATGASGDPFDRLLRPALACAAVLTLVATLLFARSATAPVGGDIASLAEDDSLFEALP